MPKIRLSLKDVTVLFPLHIDERARSARFAIAKLMMRRGEGRRYNYGLHKISLLARPGDRIGIVGRNGCGKTTLLRTLSGVYEPDHGKLIRYGKTISLINLTMGMDLYATGIENIKRRSILYGMNIDEIEATIENVKAFSELGDYIYAPVRTYSSGMLARLAFGIATSVKTDIILMDEWISAGDVRFIEQAENRMKKFLSDDRIMFLASHSEGLIRKWCNKIIVLSNGEMMHFSDDIDAGLALHKEIMNAPAQPRVAAT
ncbi:MAG: ABC transporter ATP-binding protein [Alphaproteobacteria bacterium]